MPIPPRSWSSSFPAWPTNGKPCLSSWKPGASPTNIRSASGSPTPKTTWVRPSASRQAVQAAVSPHSIREQLECKLSDARYPLRNWSFLLLQKIQVIGLGRVGSAVAARLGERVSEQSPELVLLCVPDRAIAEVARTIPLGPW